MNTTAKRTATPRLVVGMLRMLPLDIQIHMIFGNMGVTMLPKDGNRDDPEIVILNTEENKERALKFRYGMLEQQKDLSGVFWCINKPDRLQILHIVSGMWEMNGEYETILRDAWVSTEFPHQMKNAALIQMFKDADASSMMTDNEHNILNGLPDKITIYRGCQDDRAKIKALSWTTNYEIAHWFATRWNKTPSFARIYKSQIEKKHVFAYIQSRNEEEIILNPNHLKRITLVGDL